MAKHLSEELRVGEMEHHDKNNRWKDHTDQNRGDNVVSNNVHFIVGEARNFRDPLQK